MVGWPDDWGCLAETKKQVEAFLLLATDQGLEYIEPIVYCCEHCQCCIQGFSEISGSTAANGYLFD